MEPTIYKPGTYKTPGVYNGAGGIYKGRGVYNDGAGGGLTDVILDCDFSEVENNEIISSIGNNFQLNTTRYSITENEGIYFFPNELNWQAASFYNDLNNNDVVKFSSEIKVLQESYHGWVTIGGFDHGIKIEIQIRESICRFSFDKNGANYTLFNGAVYDTEDLNNIYIKCPFDYGSFNKFAFKTDYTNKIIEFFKQDVKYIEVQYSNLTKPNNISCAFFNFENYARYYVKKVFVDTE